MALLGLYVGVIPVMLGMFLLPLLRRAGPAAGSAADGLHGRPAAFLIVDGCSRDWRSPARARSLRRRRCWSSSAPSSATSRSPGSTLDASRGERRGARRRAASTSRCSSRSGSGCTTSARASRSAPPTRSARSRSAPCSSSASRSTTRARGSAIVGRRPPADGRRCSCSLGLGLIAGGPAIVGALFGASAFNGASSPCCSASAPARSSR